MQDLQILGIAKPKADQDCRDFHGPAAQLSQRGTVIPAVDFNVYKALRLLAHICLQAVFCQRCNIVNCPARRELMLQKRRHLSLHAFET